MQPNWQQNQPGGRNSAMPNQAEDDVMQRPLGSRQETGKPYQGRPAPPQGGQAWYQPPSSNPWAAERTNPFDEPPEAPELRRQRSDHLYNREDRFWEQVDTGTGTAKHSGRQKPVKSSKPESHTLRWVILILLVLAVVGGLVYSAVFQVRSITVQGMVKLTENEVKHLSGITEGMNIFAIDDNQVEKNINSNRYLSFVCVDKQLPDQVVIQVRERIPAAAVKFCGILYTMDNRGMVLEESLNMEEDSGLVLVNGMDVHDCRVGSSISLNSSKQMTALTEILVELKVMSGLEQVKELDLSNMDNLFIVSRDGFTVRLGQAGDIHAKLRSMLLTLEHLRSEGYKGGTVDVSSPVNPTYIPES